MPAAKYVERQIAVVVVIAVEETVFLMSVQRVVGGVEIEGDLQRRRQMGVDKQVDKQALDRRPIMADLVIAVVSARLNSSRLSVDLPASGAQSERFAASLPPSTAITGSWRNWS